MNDNAEHDPRLHAIPDTHGHAKGEHKAFTDERPIPLSARMLFLWFYHACRRGSPRFLMVSDHMNYLTFEDPAAINLVRRALKLAQAGDLYGAAETASVEVGHAAIVSEGLRRGMRYSIGAEVDNDPRSRPDAQNIVDAMKPDGMIRSVHFLTIDHPAHGPNWNWPFDNPEFADVYEIVGTAKLWELYMATLLDAVERLPGNIVGHFYVPALFGHWPDDATLDEYENQLVDACEGRGMAIEFNTRFLYREHSDEEKAKYLAAHRRLLAKCKAKNVGIAVGSDAHSPKDQGGAFTTVLALLDECEINELVFPLAGRLARVALRVERKPEPVPEPAPAPSDERKSARRARPVEPAALEEASAASTPAAEPPKAKPARPKRKPKVPDSVEAVGVAQETAHVSAAGHEGTEIEHADVEPVAPEPVPAYAEAGSESSAQPTAIEARPAQQAEAEPEEAAEDRTEPAAAEAAGEANSEAVVGEHEAAEIEPDAASAAPEAEPAVVAEAEPAVVAEAEPAIVAEAEPAVVAEAERAVVAETEPAVVAETEPVIVAETEPAVVAETEPEIVAEAEAAAAAAAEAEVTEVIEADFESVAGAEAEPEPAAAAAIEPARYIEIVETADALVSAPIEDIVGEAEFEPIVTGPAESAENEAAESAEGAGETLESPRLESEENVVIVVAEPGVVEVVEAPVVRRPRSKAPATKAKASVAKKPAAKPKPAAKKAAKPAVKAAAKKAAAKKTASKKAGAQKSAAKKAAAKKAAPKKAAPKKTAVRATAAKKAAPKKPAAKKTTPKKAAQRRR